MKTVRNILLFTFVVGQLSTAYAQAAPRFDVLQLKERILKIAPQAECRGSNDVISVTYNVEQKSVHPRLKDGGTAKQLVVMDLPKSDGWFVHVAFQKGPYGGALYRPPILNLAKPKPTDEPREEPPYFRPAVAYRPAADEHIVVNVAFGEKADLNALKAVYRVLSTRIQGLPELSD
ncbi:MAG: hypothetical protein ACLQM8_07720 [Limisphaerales bacterium]